MICGVLKHQDNSCRLVRAGESYFWYRSALRDSLARLIDRHVLSRAMRLAFGLFHTTTMQRMFALAQNLIQKNSHFHGAAPSFMLNFFALLGTVAHSLLAIRPASSSLPRCEADNAAHARKRQQCRDQTLGHCLQITAFPGSVAVSGHRLLHYDPAEPQKNATCAKHTDQG